MSLNRLLTDMVAPVLLGVLAAFGFAPWSFYPATLAALIGMFVLWRSVSIRRAAWRGGLFGLGYFGAGLYWIYAAIHGYAGVPAPLAGLVVAALIVYLACYPALAGAIAAASRRLPAPLWALIVVPAAWGIGELLRGWVGSGFGWLALGYATIDAPVTGLAPVIGVYGIGMVLCVGAGVIWLLYTQGVIARLIALGVIVLAPVLVWWWPPAAHWTHASGSPLQVAVVQGNIDQSDKWQPEAFAPTLMRYRDMTERSDEADLVVWPEVAIAAPTRYVKPYLTDLQQRASQRDQTILAGVLTTAGPNRFYNTVLALGRGEGRYIKRHLVPFGEYVPGPDWLTDGLAGLGAPVGNSVAGPLHQSSIHSHGTVLGVSICFEDLFARDIARDLPTAGVLVNVTNDAWFKGTPGLAQHLTIARMRALESGRPMIRAANTGISALIDSTGRLIDRTAADKTVRLEGSVRPRQGATPYIGHGNTPLWWACLTIVVLGGLTARGLLWRDAYRRRPAERRQALRARL